MREFVCVCVTHCHYEGVHKYGDHSHLYGCTHERSTDNSGSVTGESELQRMREEMKWVNNP